MNLQYRMADKEDIPKIYNLAKDLIDQYEDISAIDYEKVLAWVNRKIETHISEYCCVQTEGQTCAYYRLCEDGELDDLRMDEKQMYAFAEAVQIFDEAGNVIFELNPELF